MKGSLRASQNGDPTEFRPQSDLTNESPSLVAQVYLALFLKFPAVLILPVLRRLFLSKQLGVSRAGLALEPLHTMDGSGATSETASKSGAVDSEAQIDAVSTVIVDIDKLEISARGIRCHIVNWEGPSNPMNPQNWTRS